MVLATWVIFVHAFAPSFINLRKVSSFTLDFLEEETRNYRNHYLTAHSVLINKSRTQLMSMHNNLQVNVAITLSLDDDDDVCCLKANDGNLLLA